MSEQLQKETINIMDKCKQVLQEEKPNQQKTQQSNKRNKSKQILLNSMNSKISPSEESQNNKIIEKLRRKYNKKKQVKQIVIRKTDLGQNQMIFNKQELQKLKEIDDDEEMFGYSKIKGNQNVTLKNNISQQKEDQSKKYFFNPTFDKPKEEIQKYLDWVNLNEVKGSKDKNKNKIINFQKRQNSSTPNLLNGVNKQKFPLLNGSPKNISLFAGEIKHKKAQNGNKVVSLMKKSSVDKGFLNSINSHDALNHKKLTKEEKMHDIVDKVSDKIEKTLSSSASEKIFIYMTQERKQALFQCQVLRRIKRQIGPKYFNNLHLTYGTKAVTHQNEDEAIDQNKQNNKNQNEMRKTTPGQSKGFNKSSNHCGKQRVYGNQKQKDSEIQAQRMIQKNLNRLIDERKRVIEKIAC